MSSGVSRVWLAFFVVLLIASAAVAQAPASASDDGGKPKTVATPVAAARVPEAPSAHRFWDRENRLLFAGIGASRMLDYYSTRNMLSRGREEILLPDDVADNAGALAALEAAGTATSIGISCLLHRTGHHKLERWLSIGHIGVTTFGGIRNYALESKRP